MDAQEIKNLMTHLAAGVGQRAIALRCDCENLETVYVIVDDDGNVRVTDDYRTFQYLHDSHNSTYVSLQALDMATAQRLCEESGVELKPAPPDGFPSIETTVGCGQPIEEAIERVATAVDRVFNLAMRPDLK